jgi:hypothetical protein
MKKSQRILGPCDRRIGRRAHAASLGASGKINRRHGIWFDARTVFTALDLKAWLGRDCPYRCIAGFANSNVRDSARDRAAAAARHTDEHR